MFELKQYDGSVVSPRDDAILYDMIIAGSGVFSGMQITHLGANQLLITEGRGIIKGRMWEHEKETIKCSLASDGTLRGRAYIHMDLTNVEQPIRIMTIAAETLPDLVQDEECNYTNGIYEIELCQYDVTDLAISNLIITYPVLGKLLSLTDIEIEEIYEELYTE